MKYNNFWNLMGVSLICITMIGVSNANAKTTTLFTFDVNNAAPGANGCSAKVTTDANDCTIITERALNANNECQDTSTVRTVCPGAPGAPGAACQSKIVSERCGGSGEPSCPDTTKKGMLTKTYKCDGTTLESTSASYDGANGSAGAACQSKIVSERCGGSGEPSCPDTTKKGVLTKTYKCDGTTLQSTSASYDGENGQNGQDFDPCNGSNSSSVLKSSSTSYSIGSKVSGKNYYAAPGKVIESRIMCDDNAGTPFETPDTCVEVARGSSGCTSPNVYKQCKPANGGAAYYVCESGTSILDTALAAETAAGNANPCAGSNANSNTIVKNITKASYDRGTKTNNIYSKVGTSQVQKTTCAGTTITETTQDMCIEIDKPSSSVCSGNTKAYLKCSTSAESTDTTYYVCQDLGSNTSLSGKIDGKVDSTTMNNAISAATSAATLGESLKDTFVKPSALNGYVTTSGLGDNSIGKVLESNNVITTSNLSQNNIVTTGTLGNAVTNAIAQDDTIVKTTDNGYKEIQAQAAGALQATELPTALSQQGVLVSGASGKNSLAAAVAAVLAEAGTCSSDSETVTCQSELAATLRNAVIDSGASNVPKVTSGKD